MRAFLLLLLILGVPAAARAQPSPPVPPIVTAGFEAYRAQGPEAALEAWLAGWGEEDIAHVREQLMGTFEQMVAGYGKYIGHEILGTVDWGDRARRVYVLLLYERKPMYGRLDVYRGTGDWRVLNVTVNTDPAEVFPPGLLVPPGFGGPR